MANALADRLDDLALRVERLSPSHRQPERFSEDKSEIIAELRREAREQRRWPAA
jgi:chaperonin cofactor prefoldin